MKLDLLYRDGANYKTNFYHTVYFKDFPEARDLVVGSEILMGEFGTPTQEEFFNSNDHPYSYNEEYDHDIFEIVEIL